jgi:hypothetical protein
MLTRSQINTEGKAILKDIFSPVLKNGTKQECKQALEFLHQKIYRLEITAKQHSISDSEKSSEALKQGYYWKNCRQHFLRGFAKRFLKKTCSLSPQND